MVIILVFCYTIVMFYELHIYIVKYLLLFILYNIILILKICSTSPYLLILLAQGGLKL